MIRNKTRAAVAALALTLAVTPAAFAATSQTTTDSFSVNASLAITGVPATVSYGNLDAGATSGVVTVDTSVVANVPWEFTISGTDFDRAGGGSIGKGARQVLLSSTGGGVSFQVAPSASSWQAFDSATILDATPDATGGSTAGANVRAELRVTVPGDAAAGDYSGSVTFVVSAQ